MSSSIFQQFPNSGEDKKVEHHIRVHWVYELWIQILFHFSHENFPFSETFHSVISWVITEVSCTACVYLFCSHTRACKKWKGDCWAHCNSIWGFAIVMISLETQLLEHNFSQDEIRHLSPSSDTTRGTEALWRICVSGTYWRWRSFDSTSSCE